MADSDLVIDNIIYEIGKRIYPIGSIYISLNSTNPGTLFGGSWVRVYDAVLHAVSNGSTPGTSPTSSTNSYVGSNSVQLTRDNMPYYSLGFLPSVVMSGVDAWDADAKTHDSGTGPGTYANAYGSGIVWDRKWANTPGQACVIPDDVTYILQRIEDPSTGSKSNQVAKTANSAQWGFSIYTKTFKGHTRSNGDAFSILPKRLDVYVWRRYA